MIVLEDADLDEAVRATNFGAFFHQGQICMNTRKVYVARRCTTASSRGSRHGPARSGRATRPIPTSS